MPKSFIIALLAWFGRERRFLPWRVKPTPYTVWISEVMLQQTQASRVASFFQKWLAKYPTIQALAESQEEEVMKVWEGLGYYSRARALRQGAQYIQDRWGGQIPREKEALLSIPGIGDYTQGAIRSFAFHEKAPAVDANVVRVIARVYDLPLEQGKQTTNSQVASLVEELLPQQEPWVVMEALIELGALLCGRKPSCAHCPVQRFCRAFGSQTVTERPLPKKKQTRIYEKRAVFLFYRENKVCVVKRQGRQAMSGLWEFPYASFKDELPSCGLEPDLSFDIVYHTYTKYSITLYPLFFRVPSSFVWHEGDWVDKDKLSSLAFSSGHKRLVEQVLLIL